MRTWRTRSVARRCGGRCKYLARRSGKPWNAACTGSHGPGSRAERHQAGARLGRRGTFAGNPAAHPREHLSQNSHHHLAHRVIHSVSGAHPGPWEASRADRPGDFRNIGGGQKTANPAGHGRDLARHFLQHFANSFIHKISTAVRRSTAGRSLPAKPRVGRIPGAAPAARFRHSLPTAFPQETRGTGMPVKMSPGLPLSTPDAHEYWVFRLSRKVRGDRRKHARRRHGWIRCPQFRDAPSWRIPQHLFPSSFANREKSCGSVQCLSPDRRRHFFNGECEQLFHRQTHRSASCRPGISQGGFKVPERFPRIACRKPDGHIPQWLVQSFRTRATHRLIHSMRTVHNGGSEITRQRRDISVDFPD
ncbi:hypothetical protein BN889_00185 [Pseudomonas aeruginosa PA38182]|nr:hypothetical protein BN889_00185 [Pseudomonas aeruginosa PA38182]